MTIIENYWQRVNKQLKNIGASLTLMAKEMEIDYPTMIQWRTHNRIPNPEALIKISAFLDVTIDYLLTGTTSKNIEDVEVMAVKSNDNIRTVVRCCTQDPDYLKTALYIARSVKK